MSLTVAYSDTYASQEHHHHPQHRVSGLPEGDELLEAGTRSLRRRGAARVRSTSASGVAAVLHRGRPQVKPGLRSTLRNTASAVSGWATAGRRIGRGGRG